MYFSCRTAAHLEVEHAALDVLPLARDRRDVLRQVSAEVFELAHQQRPAQGRGLAVVVCLLCSKFVGGVYFV